MLVKFAENVNVN